MTDLDFLFDEEEKLTEENMVSDISERVNYMNYLTNKIHGNIRHLNLQLICLIICYFFTIFTTVTIFFGIVSFISLFLASSNYGKRKDVMRQYWFLISKYKEKNILTKQNKHKIEDLKIEKLWFEKY